MKMISLDDIIEYCDNERTSYQANNCGAACTALRRLAEFAKEYAVEAEPDNDWISVDDRLPEAIYDCLVWYSCDTPFGKSKSVDITYCSRGDWCTKHLNGDNIVVLYWLPLPEPPKEVENETD